MTTEKPGPEARVVFELAVEDGWPPVGSERVWAHHLGGDRYRIANAPWFARDLAVGDVVRAQIRGRSVRVPHQPSPVISIPASISTIRAEQPAAASAHGAERSLASRIGAQLV
jgi:hypothetical protein